MAHPTFGGFDDGSLLAFFLEHRGSGDLHARRRAHLAWTVLCARQIERMRAYIVLFRRRQGRERARQTFDDAVLRVAVERALASSPGFEGDTLGEFRKLIRRIAHRACAEALARGEA